jgi:hypothetical protein
MCPLSGWQEQLQRALELSAMAAGVTPGTGIIDLDAEEEEQTRKVLTDPFIFGITAEQLDSCERLVQQGKLWCDEALASL